MSRKKVILSIVLLVALVLAGIVLPALWKADTKNQRLQTKSTKTSTEKETASDSSEEKVTALKFQEFDQLSNFFSDSQIRSLKAQCITYLLTIEKGDLTSITFQPDQTSYPDKNTIRLIFELSDDASLPITYSTPTGVFYFGEEKLQMEMNTTIYEQETDDTLPSLTTGEIEVQQEGGYADTDKTQKEVQP